jgi:hypothetical protein
LRTRSPVGKIISFPYFILKARSDGRDTDHAAGPRADIQTAAEKAARSENRPRTCLPVIGKYLLNNPVIVNFS